MGIEADDEYKFEQNKPFKPLFSFLTELTEMSLQTLLFLEECETREPIFYSFLITYI